MLVRTRRDDLCNAPINDESEDCTGGIERFVYAGDNVLWEMRGPGADSVPANRLEDISATPQEYGVVGYTHAGGIDRPLLLWKGTGATPSAVVAPRVNWRGVYSGGTYLVGSATNYPIVWPGYNTNAWHRAAPDPQEPTRNWMGSLIEGQVDASGQMYMRNRMYDPATGQFTQSDPIGIGGGLNTYGFAAGDPVSYSDPYGLCKRDRRGNEDPECRQVVNALRAAAADANVAPGERNRFAEAADRYEATERDVVIVGAREQRLNARRLNTDGKPDTYAMGRTMPNSLFRGKGDILIGDFLGQGDFVLTAAHEMLGHDEQKILTDVSPRIDELNGELWNQLPGSLRPSAELWRRKLGQ